VKVTKRIKKRGKNKSWNNRANSSPSTPVYLKHEPFFDTDAKPKCDKGGTKQMGLT
jgi:hypothetical protein